MGIGSKNYCGLVGSVSACCEFDSWQCRIYIPCSLSLRLLGSLLGSLSTYGLTQKLCFKKRLKTITQITWQSSQNSVTITTYNGPNGYGWMSVRIYDHIKIIKISTFQNSHHSFETNSVKILSAVVPQNIRRTSGTGSTPILQEHFVLGILFRIMFSQLKKQLFMNWPFF